MAEHLMTLSNGAQVRHAGIVTVRQRPETANATMVLGLEDETGNIQVVVWKSPQEQFRDQVMRSRLLEVRGTWQREGDATSIVAANLEDLTPLLGRLETESRDFR